MTADGAKGKGVDHIAEENRVFALIKAVKTDEEFNAIESPLWEKV